MKGRGGGHSPRLSEVGADDGESEDKIHIADNTF